MTAGTLIVLILDLSVILCVAQVTTYLARLVGQPPVIGEIVGGILLGPTLLGTFSTGTLFPADVRVGLGSLANLGLILFMFIVGYELDPVPRSGQGRLAAGVAAGSIVAPFGLGIALGLWLAPRHGVDDRLSFVLYMGVAMSITAFPVLARILTDRGMLRTRLGGVALTGAAITDAVVWTLLVAVVTIAGGSHGQSWRMLVMIPYLLAMVFGVRPLLRRLVRPAADPDPDADGGAGPHRTPLLIAGLLLSALVTEWTGLHFLFGAFLFGAIMPRGEDGVLRAGIVQSFSRISSPLLPVFFVLAGLNVDLSRLSLVSAAELALILVVGCVGKFGGAFLGGWSRGAGLRGAGVLGVLMNTRGLTELIVLGVGLQLGILDRSLYSFMVIMALVATAMAGPLLGLLYPRWRIDQDLAEADAARRDVVVPLRQGAAGEPAPARIAA